MSAVVDDERTPVKGRPAGRGDDDNTLPLHGGGKSGGHLLVRDQPQGWTYLSLCPGVTCQREPGLNPTGPGCSRMSPVNRYILSSQRPHSYRI